MRARPCGDLAIVSHIECSHVLRCRRRTQRRSRGDLTSVIRPAAAEVLSEHGRRTPLSGSNGCRETTVGGEMVASVYRTRQVHDLGRHEVRRRRVGIYAPSWSVGAATFRYSQT